MNISGHLSRGPVAADQAGPSGHVRHANFGALNSAIRRGDLIAAQTSLAALSASDAPSAKAVLAKGSLDGIGAALAAGDLTAARQALTAFKVGRTDRGTEPPPPPAPAPAPAAPGTGLDFLV